MNKTLPIPSVTELIARCWTESETAIRTSFREKHPDLDEVFITRLFHDVLRETFHKISDEGKVEEAFLKDLRKAFPTYAYSEVLANISSGLVASVTLHPPKIEEYTGGDLGLLLTRPNVSESYDYETKLIVGGYRRGLLCQAKVKRRNGKWGQFSKNQKKMLPNHVDYLALLLYEYADLERLELLPFHWQLCKDSHFKQIKNWIKSGSFPMLQTSEHTIDLLGKDKIGTDDNEIIDEFICPKTRSYMEIKIFWPDKSSGFEVKLLQKIPERQKQYVYVKV